MRKLTYNPAEDFNFTYDGKVLVITGAKDRAAVQLNVPPVIGGRQVRVIGNSAFSMCHKLKKIIIPDSVTAIENSAFRGCASLEEAELSRELVSIGAAAFAGCGSLKKIFISNNTGRFEVNSFKGCTALTIIGVKYKESDRIEDFAIAAESDEARWLYLRGIERATDPRGGYMDKYDATFLEIRNEDDKYNIAVHRLKNPRDLTPEMKSMYINALSGMVLPIIYADRVDKLTVIGGLGCIDNSSMREYIDAASRIGGGCIAYLLEHQNRYGMNHGRDFSL
ncbi:MAG: leucine-rich repeat domain-containing protein [Firmicutes bacterium]|nr:leucine-rich repeat domain-containing protein [Bacillota bacterium]